jgi:hypothetical protein
LTLETDVEVALLVAAGVAAGVPAGVAAGVAGEVLPAVVLSDVVGVALGLGVALVEGAAIGALFDEKVPEPTKIAVAPRRTSTRMVAITPGENGPCFFWAGATRGWRGRRVLPPLRWTGAAMALSFIKFIEIKPMRRLLLGRDS